MNRRRICNLIPAVVLSLIMGAAMTAIVFAQDNTGNDNAPLPSELLDEYTVLPSDSYSFTDQKTENALLNEGKSYPAAYDLRTENLVTPVKLQNPFGSCWAFAAISAAETSLINQGLVPDNSVNLSERHLAYFTYTSIQDERSSQYGEGYKDKGMSASEKLGIGGNSALASAVMASGAGPVLEGSDPDFIYKGQYGNKDQRIMPNGQMEDFSYSANDNWSIPYERRNEADFALKESYILPIPAQIDENKEYSYNEAATTAIKKQLLEGRAVQIGFLADQAAPGDDDIDPVMLSDTWAHYTTYVNVANHAVTIVGWDDTIGAEGSPVQFREDSNPIKDRFGPGAWLVKNSWGSGENEFPNKGTGTWGIRNEDGDGTGYFWLSYYDHSIANVETVAFEENQGGVMEAYDYMPPIEMHETGFESEVKSANMFYASANEVLDQISFYTTHPNTSVHYDVYVTRQDSPNPEAGLLVASGDFGPYEFGGFHKEKITSVDPARPVTLMYGQSFSIVITEKRSDGQYSVCLPIAPAKDYESVVNSGESSFYQNGRWYDLRDTDACSDLLELDPDYQEMTADNFPIKGYAQPLGDDVMFNAGLSGTQGLYFTPENDQSTLKLSSTTYLGTSLPRGVRGKWELDGIIKSVAGDVLEEGDLFTISGLDENGFGTKATVHVRHEGDKYYEGSSNLYVHLYGQLQDGEETYLGTIVEPVSAARLTFSSVRLADQSAEYVYDGSAFEPEVVAEDLKGNTMRKDVDYTVSYKNNMKCGVATVLVDAAGDYVANAPYEVYFPIRPAAATANTATAGALQMTVSVEDQKSTGVTGYEIQYRPKGTSKWSAKKVKAGASSYKIANLKAGKSYEARVRGYLEVTDSRQYWGINKYYYGQYSAVKTSGTVKPAKAAVSKLAAGSKKLTVTVKNQKSTGITGYQIQYRVKGTAKWKSKTLKASAAKLVIKKLKAGKKYQVKVRGYVTVSGKKVYGAYSTVKTSAAVKK